MWLAKQAMTMRRPSWATEEVGEHGAHRALRAGVPGLLGVGGVGEQQPDAGVGVVVVAFCLAISPMSRGRCGGRRPA